MWKSWRDVRIFGQRRRRHFDAWGILLSTLDIACLAFYTSNSFLEMSLEIVSKIAFIYRRRKCWKRRQNFKKGKFRSFCDRFLSRSSQTSIGDLSSKRVLWTSRVYKNRDQNWQTRVFKRAKCETELPLHLPRCITFNWNKHIWDWDIT